MPSPTTGSFAMLPPLTGESSMLTFVTNELRKLDVPTASDISSSFKFKPQANLDPNSLSPYCDSQNQVLSFIIKLLIVDAGVIAPFIFIPISIVELCFVVT
jgi:hypothetical protein